MLDFRINKMQFFKVFDGAVLFMHVSYFFVDTEISSSLFISILDLALNTVLMKQFK